MFVDASVIVAILGREPGYEEIEKARGHGRWPFFVSPLVKFEASVALAANTKPSPDLPRQAQGAVDAIAEDLGADEMAISAEIERRAVDTSATYGKAVGHAADLNFGDRFAYACAKVLDVALLYKGGTISPTPTLPDERARRMGDCEISGHEIRAGADTTSHLQTFKRL